MKGLRGLGVLASLICGLFGTSAFAADALKPYVLAYTATGSIGGEAARLRAKLAAAGFELLGEYLPYPGAEVIAVTSPALKAAAAQDGLGFSAVEHIAITEVKGSLQVSYLNPAYVAAAYRMTARLDTVAEALKAAIGAEKTFGSESGLSAEDLSTYNFQPGLERYADYYELAQYESHEAAIKAVENNLSKRVGGVVKVYRVDIPGKTQSVFGISRADVADVAANDKGIAELDAATELKTTAYLPWQLIVNGPDVIALHKRFRLAVWHPDMKPEAFNALAPRFRAVEELLRQVADGKRASSAP